MKLCGGVFQNEDRGCGRAAFPWCTTKFIELRISTCDFMGTSLQWPGPSSWFFIARPPMFLFEVNKFWEPIASPLHPHCIALHLIAFHCLLWKEVGLRQNDLRGRVYCTYTSTCSHDAPEMLPKMEQEQIWFASTKSHQAGHHARNSYLISSRPHASKCWRLEIANSVSCSNFVRARDSPSYLQQMSKEHSFI